MTGIAEKNYRIDGRFYDTILKIIDWEKEKRRIGESFDDWAEAMDRIAHRYHSIKSGNENDDQFFCWDIIAVFKDIIHYVLEDHDAFSSEAKPDWFKNVETLQLYMNAYSPTCHIPNVIGKEKICL